MTKEILFGKDSRDKMLLGIQKLANAVKVTVGASGKCVLIGEALYGNDGLVHLPTKVSKDGWTVCRYFSLPDVVENRGAMMLTEAATKTMETAGDATSCTIVLAEALITGGMKLIDEGANSQQLKKGMDAALAYVVDELKKISIPVKGDINRIRQVATVSANNDEVIGNLIADAYSKIGDDGTIDIEESTSGLTSVKISEGYKFDNGWVSPLFVNNPAKESCVFEDALILLYQKRILHHTQIEKAVTLSLQIGKPLLIICDDADEEGLAFLAMNNHAQKIRVCLVKAPFIGTDRLNAMEDMALLTGATYVSDQRGVDIKQIGEQHLGKAKKVIITKGETIIIGGNGDKSKIDAHVAGLKETALAANTEEERYPIEKRIATIKGSIAVISVGAATQTELREKIDRVDDAVRATKAAIAEGFVAGGGTAFTRIASRNYGFVAKDAKSLGYNLVLNALESPLLQICENAGEDSASILDKVLKSKGDYGYNVLTDSIEDMVQAGIIDSTKALRCALTNAVSVAGMVLTSECSIISTY